MTKALRLALAAVATLATLAAASTAVASPPQPVTITVNTSLTDPNAVDPFAATGGVVCSAGQVSTPVSLFVGWQSQFQAQIIIVKHFVCGDGTFDVLLRVKLDFATGETRGTWSVLSGTGAYAKLHGSGTLTGEPMGATILDVYTGSMHFD